MNAKRLRHSLLLVVAVVTAGCASTPPSEVATGDARAVFATYVAAFNAQEWGRVVSLYSDRDGFQWVENGKVVYASKDDVARSFEWLREHARRAVYQPSDTNITGLSGNTAQISTRFVTRVETADGRRLTYSGDMRMELRRENGVWKIVGGESRTASAPTVAPPLP